ncbi:MAG: YkgJ family cysteine cluster protein [Methanotrichaceae archaeon]|nr:YkgJ family cysteine cluster protein [Methanotrichaceae archaeon]
MDASADDLLSKVCFECQLNRGCCFAAKPPLTNERIKILLDNGVSGELIEFAGYKRLKVKPDGFCVLFRTWRCGVHLIKPETCVAGPFTFDLRGSILEIYLKKKSICPMVELLKENREIFERLLTLAAENIMKLLKALPKDELAEILKIDEPETELVAEIWLQDWSSCC